MSSKFGLVAWKPCSCSTHTQCGNKCWDIEVTVKLDVCSEEAAVFMHSSITGNGQIEMMMMIELFIPACCMAQYNKTTDQLT